MPDSIAYKVLTADQLDALEHQGSFAGAPVDLADGYIHLSTADQLAGTIDKHFAGQTGLQLVAVDLEALGDAVKWEESRGGALFPHIYGAPITLDVVLAYSPLEYEPNGEIRLPVTG
ncbi:MAG: DUF952 domain-containing protein [Sphingomonas sp.]|nr:DUF952 domain-containing protein [Sphingomonas sp.]